MPSQATIRPGGAQQARRERAGRAGSKRALGGLGAGCRRASGERQQAQAQACAKQAAAARRARRAGGSSAGRTR